MKITGTILYEPHQTSKGNIHFQVRTETNPLVFCFSDHDYKPPKLKQGDKVTLEGDYGKVVSIKGDVIEPAFIYTSLEILK